jgi:hypothetical protein
MNSQELKMYRQSALGMALSAIVLSLVLPAHAEGQNNGSGPVSHQGMLVGVVVDSINGRVLTGATVMVDGTPLLATSDNEGRFRIDSIPPGSYRVAVFHPMLDSLGMTIGSQQMRFGPDSIRQVLLSTPSAETLIAEWCPPASRRLGPAALVGRVLDPETAAPIAGARVTIAWEEMELDVVTVARRRVPRVRSATSDETGRFALCGMGAATRGTLQAERGSDKTPELPVAMDGRTFAMHTILLGRSVVSVAATSNAGGELVAAGSQRMAQSTGSATVAGRVVDGAGRPVAGVRVTVDGTGASAVSDSAGSFSVARVPAGSWVVAAHRIGFRPSEVTVNVLPRRTERVTLRLDATATTLATVVSEATVPGLERVGFADRKRSGMGRYLTSDQIAERRPMRTTELFETIPGIQVLPNGRGGFNLRSSREANGCVTVFIDGMQWTESAAGDLDMALTPEQVAAVEVYSASTRPGEFSAAGQAQCTAVVFWTKTRVGQRQ